MGYVNATLIRRLASAIQRGNETEKRSAKRLLTETQKSCQHYPKDRKIEKIPQNSPLGRYKKGGTLDYCKRCGKIVKYYRPGIMAPSHGPTSWETILGEDSV